MVDVAGDRDTHSQNVIARIALPSKKYNFSDSFTKIAFWPAF